MFCSVNQSADSVLTYPVRTFRNTRHRYSDFSQYRLPLVFAAGDHLECELKWSQQIWSYITSQTNHISVFICRGERARLACVVHC